MTAFAETSFFCALLRTQVNTNRADAWMTSRQSPIAVSTLVLYEFRQGVHFQAWLRKHDATKGYSAGEAAAMLARLDENMELGIFRILSVDWTAVHERAGQLADRHTPANGARGFDLLHVATALEINATEFLSFDGPQREIAQSEGLTVLP